MNYYIVVDLGATKTRIALSNSEKSSRKQSTQLPRREMNTLLLKP